MHRAEAITLIQVSRGLKIAACNILNGHMVSHEGIVSQEDKGSRTNRDMRQFSTESEYGKRYYYKIPVGLTLEQGDLVVLPVRDTELVIGRVKNIHRGLPDELDISKLKYNLRWVMSKIDPRLHDIMVAEEQSIGAQMQQAELNRKLSELQQYVGYSLDTISTPMLDGKAETPANPDPSGSDA